MTNLSKSKLLAWRQCPRRLWLEIHRPELRQDSATTLAGFATGHTVGEIARRLYDPEGQGLLIDAQASGFAAAYAQTRAALQGRAPVFEAGFAAAGALAFADIMLPVGDANTPRWRMVEVKSSSSVKDYHHDDAAIQAHVARSAGVALESIALAHIDTAWVYPGGGDYRGLLAEEDLTDEAFARGAEVGGWIAEAQGVAVQAAEPARHTGAHCRSPFACGFMAHCQAGEPQAEHPVAWLPQVKAKALKEFLAREDIIAMEQVPDTLLNQRQARVKHCTLTGETHFDAEGARRALQAHPLPGLFLDFETISFVVPIWAGTRPYQQIPFQFSLHTLMPDGQSSHREFLDLSGADPSAGFADELLSACASPGPIFVYNKGFEGARIRELAERFDDKRAGLLALLSRLVDLLPIAEKHFYHPSQHGSWSIKKVLPAMAPDLRYDALQGVQHGAAAMVAYLEATAPDTSADRREEIRRQLLAYCGLDTWAMVRVWSVLTDHPEK